MVGYLTCGSLSALPIAGGCDGHVGKWVICLKSGNFLSAGSVLIFSAKYISNKEN
jgi:hypothetical protein